jgi:hypothetical protein
MGGDIGGGARRRQGWARQSQGLPRESNIYNYHSSIIDRANLIHFEFHFYFTPM